MANFRPLLQFIAALKGSVCYKTHGKKIPGQKTPWIKNNKAKLDIKHQCKIGQKTLIQKNTKYNSD